MAATIRWSTSVDKLISFYRIQSGATSTGSWSTVADVTHSLTGSDFDSALGLFVYTDVWGAATTWYRVTPYNSGGQPAEPSAPFQSDAFISPPLAGVDEFKSYLEIAHTDDDALAARLIDAAAAYVHSYTGQEFRVRLKTEMRDGDGGRVMRLHEPPVISVLSLSVDGQAIPESTGTTIDGWFLMEGHVRLRGQRFTRGAGNVQISYTCGYPVTPPDIRQAVIELASLKYRDRTRVGKSTEAMSGLSVSYLPSLIPASVQAVLDAYRRVVA